MVTVHVQSRELGVLKHEHEHTPCCIMGQRLMQYLQLAGYTYLCCLFSQNDVLIPPPKKGIFELSLGADVLVFLLLFEFLYFCLCSHISASAFDADIDGYLNLKFGKVQDFYQHFAIIL